jgi:phage terminase Nu1 subunit (DNA packaging protein)
MKQTAVEWLLEQLKETHTQRKWEEIIEQALDMEKQQIIDACNQTEFEDIDGMGIHEAITKGEQYYKESF